MKTEIATFAGGCFWCLDSAFRRVKGVDLVESGYCGGHSESPNYETVCNGGTGHAEAVRLEFDASLVDYRTLLSFFFSLHDPTTLNRQGADIGTQYRSAIFYHNQQQFEEAKEIIEDLEHRGVWANPIVTELVPAGRFYPAEHYHQDYFANNKSNRYCQMVISPKLIKFINRYKDLLKGEDY